MNNEYVKIINEDDKWYLVMVSKYGCYINRSTIFDSETEVSEIRDLINLAYKQGISDQQDAVKKVLGL